MKNYKKILVLIILIVTALSNNSCNNQNHIDEYNINIDSLKTLPDDFYGYRNERIYIDTKMYMIWFNLDYSGNIKDVFKVTNTIDNEKIGLIKKYKIDTTKSKIIAQKFIRLSKKFKFGHINIDRKNKIAFSHKNGLPEQYVRTFNDSLKKLYLKNTEFKLLKNGWFENIEK